MPSVQTRANPRLNVEEVYRRYGGVVYRRILRFYSRQQAEEVLHEVFERVLVNAHTFRGDSSVVTWLYQLTTRYCLNRLRNEQRRRELLETHGVPLWSRCTAEASQEAVTLIGQLLDALDEEHALIAVYFFVDGMSHAEIAKVIGCSRRTVGNRIQRLQQLAKAQEQVE